MTEIGTLNVGANLMAYCTVVDCIYEWMDFAGRHNPCGYGNVLKFVTNYGTFDSTVGSRGAFVGPSGNFNAISYAATNGPADATMTSAAACQLLYATTVSVEPAYSSRATMAIRPCSVSRYGTETCA